MPDSSLIIIIFIVFIVLVGGLIGGLVSRKALNKLPFLIVGWTKKDRGVVNDERARPLFFKMQNLLPWLIISLMLTISIFIIMLLMEESASAIIIVAASGCAISGFFVFHYFKRQKEFFSFCQENEIEIIRDKEIIKETSQKNIRILKPLYIFIIACFGLLAVMDIWQKDMVLFPLHLSVAVIYLVLLLNAERKR